MNDQERGRRAEAVACAWLEAHNFVLRERRWRPPRWLGLGEVDVLAERGCERWIFEVKSAGRLNNGTFIPVISDKQRFRLYRAAAYLARMGRRPVRVGLLLADPNGGQVQFLENP